MSCSTLRKRPMERSIRDLEQSPKRLLINMIKMENGYWNREAEVGWQCFTLHADPRWEMDTYENCLQKLVKVKTKLYDLLDKNEIDGFSITMEFWLREEIMYFFLQKKNCHIHFMVISTTLIMNKLCWHKWFKDNFKEFFFTHDYHPDATFYFHKSPKIGEPYCFMYLEKRKEYFPPQYGGKFCDPEVREVYRAQHKQNEPEHQVDYNKEKPTFDFDSKTNSHTMHRTSIEFVCNMFHFSNIQWRRESKKSVTYILDGKEFDHHHFCIILSNSEHLRNYRPIMSKVFELLKKPEFYLLKHMKKNDE